MAEESYQNPSISLDEESDLPDNYRLKTEEVDSLSTQLTSLFKKRSSEYHDIPTEEEKEFEKEYGFPVSAIHGDKSYVCIANKFDEFKEEVTKAVWCKLPESVIGTLLYFLLIEHNDRKFKLFDIIKCALLIGFPVYLTYFFQGVILYEIWKSLEELNNNDEIANVCTLSSTLQFTALAVFYIYLGPSVIDCCLEAHVVLFCERAAYTGEADEGEVSIHSLHSHIGKRIVTWLMVCLLEILILIALFFVGTKFIVTSDGVANVVINSVAICFVMDIDNMAREAFQAESISEHIDSWEFDTKIPHVEEDKAEAPHAEVIKFEKLYSFWALEKSGFVVLLALVTVAIIRSSYCH